MAQVQKGGATGRTDLLIWPTGAGCYEVTSSGGFVVGRVWALSSSLYQLENLPPSALDRVGRGRYHSLEQVRQAIEGSTGGRCLLLGLPDQHTSKSMTRTSTAG
jgi:hypothetical protein